MTEATGELTVRVIDGWIIDVMALSLAAIPLVLAVSGVFAFFNFRDATKKKAEEVAKEVCPEIAERITNLYIQANLPKILEAYQEFGRGSVGGTSADDIAGAQEG